MLLTDLTAVSSSTSNIISLNLTFSGAAYVNPLCLHSSTSYLDFPKLYDTNWSSQLSEKSLIGKTESKTLYKP